MPVQFLPYALAAIGGYKGYKSAKDAGASGIKRLLGAAAGAYSGYTLGSAGIGAFGSPTTQAAFQATKTGPLSFLNNPLFGGSGTQNPYNQARNLNDPGASIENLVTQNNDKRTMMQKLLYQKNNVDKIDPFKASAMLAATTYGLGAFDQGPTDIYTPGYNMGYLDLQANRPGYTYIDPTTGEERAYDKVYAPEEAGRGDPRMGPYSMNVQRLKVGGIAQIKKFNEGGVNYLPSKVSHDENDANNYVRASGYVEDGAGVGDKDEDTMLAQLADGEFVTRADGVLGAGIIAGANPNSMKDMREKGAQYFYEQQKRYKRVFDLLQDRNGNSEQKTN
jgi:hypothetical protein